MSGGIQFAGRLGLQQRVLPAYRAAFMDELARHCRDGLSVFAGMPLPVEEINPARELQVARWTQANNRTISDPSSSLFLCWQTDWRAWLEQSDPAALIVEANPRLLTNRAIIQWMQHRGRPVLGWGLGAPPIKGALAGLRRWERQAFLSQLDGVIAYSQKGAGEYIAAGMPPERVFVASNAVIAAPKDQPQRASPSARPQVLFVGRLQARKRIDVLLRACAALPEQRQPEITIVGEGPAAAEWRELAGRIYPRARFTGALHGDALEPHFSQADLFVLPGTGGLAVQQAMAHGLPAIVAEGDGTQGDLIDASTGWIIPADDEAALTAALNEALSDIERLRRMGKAAWQRVATQVNIESMAHAFLLALHRVMEG